MSKVFLSLFYVLNVGANKTYNCTVLNENVLSERTLEKIDKFRALC